jgi:hypothetical protein
MTLVVGYARLRAMHFNRMPDKSTENHITFGLRFTRCSAFRTPGSARLRPRCAAIQPLTGCAVLPDTLSGVICAAHENVATNVVGWFWTLGSAIIATAYPRYVR